MEKKSFSEHSTLVKRILIGIWIIISVVFIIIILAVISSDDKKNVAEQKLMMSEVKCNRAIRSNLKAPSSADFADAFEQEVNENGFGTNVYSFERKYFKKNRKAYIDNIKSNIKKIIDQNKAPGADSGVLDIINNDL